MKRCLAKSSPLLVNSSASRPGHFQQIVDQLHAINTSNGFLSHLLLKEAADIAFQHHVAVGGLDADLSAGHVRIARESSMQAFEQRCRGVGSAHFNSNEIGGSKVRMVAATNRRRRKLVNPAKCSRRGSAKLGSARRRSAGNGGRSKVAQAFARGPATAGFFPNFFYRPQRQEVATLRLEVRSGKKVSIVQRRICPGRDSRSGPGFSGRQSNHCASRPGHERSAVLLRSAKATG